MTVGRGGIGASVGRLPMLAYLCGTPVLARRYLDIFERATKSARPTPPSTQLISQMNSTMAPPPL